MFRPWMTTLLVVCAIAIGCVGGDERPSAAEPPAAAHKAQKRHDAQAYEASLEKIEARRLKLAQRYKAAADEPTRDRLREQARDFVLKTLTEEIFPAWVGTPWGLGRESTSQRPHTKDMTVGCSYFVTSTLQNAGLRLSNRYKFAQAPALHIQRSFAPRKADLHRYVSIPQQDLYDSVKALPQGLYVIGLNNHVGFVHVHKEGVDFIHASYTDDQTVVIEPLLTSKAIANSRPAGYFLTPIFQDDRLIDFWLRGNKVPFQNRW